MELHAEHAVRLAERTLSAMSARNTIPILAFGAAAIAVVVAAGTWKARDTLANPEVPLLLNEAGAEWIRVPNVDGPGPGQFPTDRYAGYRVRFTVESPPAEAPLHLRSFRSTAVYLDGIQLGQTSMDPRDWKRRYTIDLAPHLSPGEHELFLSVVNRKGPPMALAYCSALGIATGKDWEAKDRGHEEWVGAATISEPHTNYAGQSLPMTGAALGRNTSIFLALAAVAAAIAFRWSSVPIASGVRWVLLAAWAALAVNNITKLAFPIGFDVAGHLEYIQYIQRNGRIPLATEGWVMFQSPLYYLVSLPLYLFASWIFEEPEAVLALRIVPFACGALLVQIVYSLLKTLWPERDDLVAIGTLVGGLLPVSLYMAQNLGNEMLTAVFTGMAILLTVKLLRNPLEHWSPVWFMYLGVVLGLALLTKVTPLILCAPVAVAIVVAAHNTESVSTPWRRTTVGLAAVFGIALVVCGWYYAANWAALGVPFMGGWHPARGYGWWQDPGYRSLHQYASFGAVFSYPAFSALSSFWDGLYSTLWMDGYMGSRLEPRDFPKWNMGAMLTTIWLSIVPMAAILLGAGRAVFFKTGIPRSVALFAAGTLALYLAALAYLTLGVPAWSTIKASYTIGLAPCYAILAALGFEWIGRWRASRAIVSGVVLSWAVFAYAGYFIL